MTGQHAPALPPPTTTSNQAQPLQPLQPVQPVTWPEEPLYSTLCPDQTPPYSAGMILEDDFLHPNVLTPLPPFLHHLASPPPFHLQDQPMFLATNQDWNRFNWISGDEYKGEYSDV